MPVVPRIACLHVPLFPLAARLRSQPDLAGEAVGIFVGDGSAARLVAATRSARRAGVRPGMTLPQARARVPRLLACARDPVAEAVARECLLEVAEGFSPRLEDGGEGTVHLDLAGLERRHPDEAELGRSLAAAAEAAGLPAWVGIASSKLAARVAAELPGSPTVVPRDEEAAFLAPLPLARLAPAAEVAATLERWGIRSVGELAHLPRNEVASRLGEAGRELHQKARGLDPHPLVPHAPPPVHREGLALEWPLTRLEPFLFVARAALERLCDRLERRGVGCARLELSLALEPDGHHERSLELPSPTREVKTLLTLVRLDLDEHPPGAPVTAFTFTAHPDAPRAAQLSLLGPPALSPDRLATTLARLFALLGADRAGSPRPVDAHRPEAWALERYAPPPPPDVRPETRAGRGLLAVRVLRPPVPLEVVTEEEPPGAGGGGGTVAARSAPTARPRELHPVVGEENEKRPKIAGRVRVASGPWHLEEGWWSKDAIARDYWDVELARGGIYRLYRERASGEWFADGVYD